MLACSRARASVRCIALAAVLSGALGHVPAEAGLTFAQLKTLENERITNENIRYKAVLNEIAYERKMAEKKLAQQLSYCTTADCKAKQRAENLREQSELDVQEEHAVSAHAQKIAQIRADIAAEEKAKKAASSDGE